MRSGRIPLPDERLAPGRDGERRARGRRGARAAVVAIGHQPDCGRVAAELTGGPEPRFPTAGLVVIDLRPDPSS